eukprot:2134725-Prymnesium_polylepis.1
MCEVGSQFDSIRFKSTPKRSAHSAGPSRTQTPDDTAAPETHVARTHRRALVQGGRICLRLGDSRGADRPVCGAPTACGWPSHAA